MKEISGDEMYYTMFSPNVIYHKKVKDVVWNEQNWRWETNGLGSMRKLEQADGALTNARRWEATDAYRDHSSGSGVQARLSRQTEERAAMIRWLKETLLLNLLFVPPMIVFPAICRGMPKKVVCIETEGRLVTDEQTVAEMELVDAATEYVHAEKRRVVALSKRGKRTCAEFDGDRQSLQMRKTASRSVLQGRRSEFLNGIYNQYLKLMLNPPEPQA